MNAKNEFQKILDFFRSNMEIYVKIILIKII